MLASNHLKPHRRRTLTNSWRLTCEDVCILEKLGHAVSRIWVIVNSSSTQVWLRFELSLCWANTRHAVFTLDSAGWNDWMRQRSGTYDVDPHPATVGTVDDFVLWGAGRREEKNQSVFSLLWYYHLHHWTTLLSMADSPWVARDPQVGCLWMLMVALIRGKQEIGLEVR